MIGAATSDLHLGFRAFSALEGGRNAREVDVERAWERAVQNMIDAGPDLVTIAGDVFHHPRVGVHAVKALRDGLYRLVQETEAHVVVIPGNHDCGRTAESLTPVVIPDDLERVHVVCEPRRLQLEIPRTGETAAVACLPFVPLGEERTYRIVPDEAADVNVLLIHAAVRGDPGADRIPIFYAGEESLDVGREADRWDVVAVGDFHEYRRLHPDALAFYSGAIERTSSNIWEEHRQKGVVVWDTDAGDLAVVEHETRRVDDCRLLDFDLDPLQPEPEDVNACLEALLVDEEAEGAIVRLLVPDFHRPDRDQVAWDAVRALKARCLHFQLDLRWAERSSTLLGGRRREQHTRTLADDARDFFEPDPEPVRECAFGYLGLEGTGTPQEREAEGQGSGEAAGEPGLDADQERRGPGQPPPAEKEAVPA